jgi:hypothetical protein
MLALALTTQLAVLEFQHPCAEERPQSHPEELPPLDQVVS